MNVTAETLESAMEFAIKAHKGQRRKGDKRPYIMHPFSVMNKIYRHKMSKNMFLLLTAAVLHDTVEDCEVTLKEIVKLFGIHVGALVEELTLDKAQYAKLGKKEYLTQSLNRMSSYALALKLCDRLDNVEDMRFTTPDFRRTYFAETKYILKNLDRKLTKTHKRLIKKIKRKMRSWKKMVCLKA